jgi:hypothetical protein
METAVTGKQAITAWARASLGDLVRIMIRLHYSFALPETARS